MIFDKAHLESRLTSQDPQLYHLSLWSQHHALFLLYPQEIIRDRPRHLWIILAVSPASLPNSYQTSRS